jgi:hypothetical protein
MRQDGRLLHSWFHGQAKQAAFLDDHAFFAAGLLDLYDADGRLEHLDRSRELVAALEERFRDPDGGGYFYTAHDGERLITRSKPGADGSVPSGNGVAAVALLRLHTLTGDEIYLRRAEEILHLFYDQARRNPLGYVTYLEALERYGGRGTEVVLVGPEGEAMVALERAAAQVFVPHLTIARVRTTEESRLAIARGRSALGGHPTAYVCRNFTCSPPVTSPVELRRLLAEGDQRP